MRAASGSLFHISCGIRPLCLGVIRIRILVFPSVEGRRTLTLQKHEEKRGLVSMKRFNYL